MSRLKHNLTALIAVILINTSFAAHADEREDLEKLRVTVLSLINSLVENGILSRDKADEMMREAESKANTRLSQMPPPEVGADGKKIVRVPYIPETVKTQMRDQIKSEVLAETQNQIPGGSATADWLSRFRFEGDLRLRAEVTRLDHSNSPPSAYTTDPYLTRAPDILGNTSNGYQNFNTNKETSRDRLRARLGANLIINDAISAGLALSTGSNTSGPTSTNQTMGQYFNKYSVVLDRAFIKYEPPESWVSFIGGRMRNPYFSTDLVWADDLNFEGFAVSLKPRVSPVANAFFTAGWFPLSVSVPNLATGRSLIAIQGGIDWNFGLKANRIKMAAALYDYHGIKGMAETAATYSPSSGPLIPNYGLRSAYGWGQRGNTLFTLNAPGDTTSPIYWGLASSFRELDLTGTVDLAIFDPIHVVLTGDVVKNLGFNTDDIDSRIGNVLSGATLSDGQSLGYLWRIQVGDPQTTKRGDWNISLAYRYLGSDAVLDAFTNSDFGLGGTNSKGTILGLNYGIAKNTWVSTRLMSSDLIDSMVPATSNPAFNLDTKFSVDLFQFDLNTKF